MNACSAETVIRKADDSHANALKPTAVARRPYASSAPMYSAIKSAVTSLTRGVHRSARGEALLRAELRDRNIRSHFGHGPANLGEHALRARSLTAKREGHRARKIDPQPRHIRLLACRPVNG